MNLNIQTLGDVMRQRQSEDLVMQGQQQARDMQNLQMMLTLKKLKDEADQRKEIGMMLKDVYKAPQEANPGTIGYGLGLDNANAQPQLKQLMEQGGDFGMDNVNAINSGAEFANKGAPVPVQAPQAATPGGVDMGSLIGGFEKLAATTGNPAYLDKAMSLKQAMQKEGFTLGKDQMRFDSNGRVIASGPKEPIDYNKPFLPDGSPNPAYQEFTLKKAKASAPNTKVEVKTGESFAKEIGPMMTESKQNALGALDQLHTADMIENALNSGKVMSGPGTSFRIAGMQIADAIGAGGKDAQEKLANTRQVIKGLAQSTLAARKQLKGQGQVSDYEGKLIEKSASGDIDSMTPAEIQTVVDVNRRLSQQIVQQHKSNLEVMKKDNAASRFVPFYDVQDYQPPTNNNRSRQELDAPPPASQYPGKIMTTPQGVKFKSDGKNWVRQ